MADPQGKPTDGKSTPPIKTPSSASPPIAPGSDGSPKPTMPTTPPPSSLPQQSQSKPIDIDTKNIENATKDFSDAVEGVVESTNDVKEAAENIADATDDVKDSVNEIASILEEYSKKMGAEIKRREALSQDLYDALDKRISLEEKIAQIETSISDERLKGELASEDLIKSLLEQSEKLYSDLSSAESKEASVSGAYDAQFEIVKLLENVQNNVKSQAENQNSDINANESFKNFVESVQQTLSDDKLSDSSETSGLEAKNEIIKSINNIGLQIQNASTSIVDAVKVNAESTKNASDSQLNAEAESKEAKALSEVVEKFEKDDEYRSNLVKAEMKKVSSLLEKDPKNKTLLESMKLLSGSKDEQKKYLMEISGQINRMNNLEQDRTKKEQEANLENKKDAGWGSIIGNGLKDIYSGIKDLKSVLSGEGPFGKLLLVGAFIVGAIVGWLKGKFAVLKFLFGGIVSKIGELLQKLPWVKKIVDAVKNFKFKNLFGPKFEKAIDGIGVVVGKILKPIRKLLDFIGPIGKYLLKLAFIPKIFRVFSFATKLFKPIAIILDVITVLMAAWKGFEKDGLKGLLKGVMAGLLQVITFGFLDFEKAYKWIEDFWPILKKVIFPIAIIEGMIDGFQKGGLKGILLGALSGLVEAMSFGFLKFDKVYNVLEEFFGMVALGWRELKSVFFSGSGFLRGALNAIGLDVSWLKKSDEEERTERVNKNITDFARATANKYSGIGADYTSMSEKDQEIALRDLERAERMAVMRAKESDKKEDKELAEILTRKLAEARAAIPKTGVSPTTPASEVIPQQAQTPSADTQSIVISRGTPLAPAPSTESKPAISFKEYHNMKEEADAYFNDETKVSFYEDLRINGDYMLLDDESLNNSMTDLASLKNKYKSERSEIRETVDKLYYDYKQVLTNRQKTKGKSSSEVSKSSSSPSLSQVVPTTSVKNQITPVANSLSETQSKHEMSGRNSKPVVVNNTTVATTSNSKTDVIGGVHRYNQDRTYRATQFEAQPGLI